MTFRHVRKCVRFRGRSVVGLVTAIALAGAQAGSGGRAQGLGESAGNGRTLAFEVVSIRPADPGTRGGGLKITADGYRMMNAPLFFQVLTAYTPQSGVATFSPDRVKGLPAWMQTERYDIEARVAEANHADWQNPARQPAMLRAMLREMFEERCSMKVHREMKQGDVYRLVVAPGGPKLTATDPTASHAGAAMPGGGVLSFEGPKHTMTLYGATIQGFLAVASQGVDRPIEDDTGLTRYDFANKLNPGSAAEEDEGAGASDPQPTLASILKRFGLELVPAKGPVETLVIDHVERPSEN